MKSEEKGIVIGFGVIIIAMVGWLMFTSSLDEKRNQAYENCSYTEDYQVICE